MPVKRADAIQYEADRYGNISVRDACDRFFPLSVKSMKKRKNKMKKRAGKKRSALFPGFQTRYVTLSEHDLYPVLRLGDPFRIALLFFSFEERKIDIFRIPDRNSFETNFFAVKKDF